MYYPFVTSDDKKLLKFIKTIDVFKGIERKIHLGDGRLEDDAQHSWHLAMMVWLFANQYEDKINLERALKMALMHDLVEIYAGDTFAFDHIGRKDKYLREDKAAKKLFKALPQKLQKEFLSLWKEHEELKSPEAKFVQAMDKAQPIIQNILARGKSWQVFKITEEMVRKNKIHHYLGSKFLMSLFNQLIKEAKQYLSP